MLERLRGGHSVISVQFVIEERFHTSFNKALRRGFASVDVLTALRISAACSCSVYSALKVVTSEDFKPIDFILR